MPSFTVKNIPDDLYKRLKQRAAANHRSINGEIIVCIEQVVDNQQFPRGDYSAGIYQLGETKKDYRTAEKEAVKAAERSTGVDLRAESREAFYRLVAEIVEDLLLTNAIREGETSEVISREEIDRILGGES